MRRRSKASGEPAKTRRAETVTMKRRNAPKAERRRASSRTSQETKVARLLRERDEALGRRPHPMKMRGCSTNRANCWSKKLSLRMCLILSADQHLICRRCSRRWSSLRLVYTRLTRV